MSSNCPPQLHLTIQPSTTSFKRSFEQFGFDLESPRGQDAGGSAVRNGNDRNKRARSASSLSEASDITSDSQLSTIASGSSSVSSSSNEVDGAPSPVAPASSGPATHISHQPPRLPTPAIQDIEMPDYPANAGEAGSFVTNLAPQDPPQQYRFSLGDFDAFEDDILRQSHLPRSPTPPPTLPPLSISEEAISADAIPFLHPGNESPSSTRVQSPSTIRGNSTEQGDEDRTSWESFSPQNGPFQFTREPFSISIPMPNRQGATRLEPPEGSSRRPILDESETIAVFRERLNSALEPIRSPSPLVPGLEDDDEIEEEELSPASVPPEPPTLPPIVTGASDDHWNTFGRQEVNPSLRDHPLPSPFSAELRSWLDESSYTPSPSSAERAPTDDWAPHPPQHPQFSSLVDSNPPNLQQWPSTQLDATLLNSDMSPTRSLLERFSTDEAPAITGASQSLFGRPSTDEAAIRSFDHSAESQGMNLSRSRSTLTSTHGPLQPLRPPVATTDATHSRPPQTRLHPLIPTARFPNELRQRRPSRDNSMDTDPPHPTYNPPRPTMEGYPNRLPQTNNIFSDWRHRPRTTSLQRVGSSNSLVTENASEVRRRTDHAEVVQRLHASSHRNSHAHRRNVSLSEMQEVEAIDRAHRRLQEQADMLERARRAVPSVGMPTSRPSFSGHASFGSFLGDSYNGGPASNSSTHDNTFAGSLAAYMSPSSPTASNNESPSGPPGSHPWFASRPSWALPLLQPTSDAAPSSMSSDGNVQRRYFDLSTPEMPNAPSSLGNRRRQSNHSLEDVFMSSEHPEPPSSSHPPSLPSPDLGGTFDAPRHSQSIPIEWDASRPERIQFHPSPLSITEATGRPVPFGDLPSVPLASPESPAEENRFSSRHRLLRPPRDPHQQRLAAQQHLQWHDDTPNRDRETQRRREHLAAMSRTGEYSRVGRPGPSSTLPQWPGLGMPDDSLNPSSMGGSFNQSVGRAAAQPRRMEFQDPIAPSAHPGGDYFADFAPGPFRNTMQQIAMQRRSSRQAPPSIPPLSFDDHDLSSFRSGTGPGEGTSTNSGGAALQPPRPPHLARDDTSADRAAAARRRMDIQDFEDRVFTSRSTAAAARADEAVNYHRRQLDLHRYISQQVRIEGSRLDTGSHPRSSSDAPVFSQAIEALRPDTLNTTRSQQLIQRFHRQRESSLDRSGQNSGGPPMPQSRMRRFSRTDVPPAGVDRDSGPRISSSSAEDLDPRQDESLQEILDAHLLRHRRGRFARTPPEVLFSFGRLGRRTRALGDYMRDEDFDESYESLISLAATIGEVKPKSTPSEVIASLESARYREWATPESDQRCPICLEDYQSTDTVLKLNNCSHWLHKECLLHWLDSANTCPVCRKSVNATPSAPPTSSGFRRIPQRHPTFYPFFSGAGPGPGPGNSGNASNGESGRRGWNPPYY